METEQAKVVRYADMFAAIGAEPRLRILRLLLSAHPKGLIVGDIQAGLGIPNSTLSHHLEKMKNEDLVVVRRDRQFLWYSANVETLGELLAFLYAECCSRSRAVQPESVIVPLKSQSRKGKS
jgi:DNA-binding transcriptional ArsR family regulator